MALAPPPQPVLVSSPSRTPAAAQIASLHGQITELVQQNDTAKKNVHHLQQDLEEEVDRRHQIVQELKTRWEAEREEWNEGCDSLQAVHNIAHLRTRIALEDERVRFAEQLDTIRKERIRSIMRDHKIVLLQCREAELLRQIDNLEDELEAVRDETEENTRALGEEYDEKVSDLVSKLSRFESQKKDKSDQVTQLKLEKSEIQAELLTLQTDYANLKSDYKVMSLKVERATLNMQAAQTQQAELKQELAAWKNLSDKEEEEVDGLRKAKVDLEVRVRAAEGRAKEAEKKDKESMKTLEKERKKSASLAREVERLETLLGDANEDVAEAEDLVEEIRAPTKAPKRNKAPVEPQDSIPRKEPTPPRERKKRLTSAQPSIAVASDHSDYEEAPAPARKPRPRPRPRPRSVSAAPSQDRSNKQASRLTEQSEDDGELPTVQAKGKQKEEVPSKRGKGKRLEDVREDAEDGESGDGEVEKPKKKRKLFGDPKPSMDWNNLFPANDGSLGIPSVLSPVTTHVPRANFGKGGSRSILSTLGFGAK